MALSLAVLASGQGSNAEALFAACERGDLAATVAVVISNNSAAPVLERARARGIAAVHLSARTHADPGAAMLSVLREHGAEVIALAGYMKLLDPRVLAAYPDRVVNVHPGPLPRFGGRGMYGRFVHEAVLAAGVTESGPTVHLVDEIYDHGRMLAHRPVPVLPGDDVASLAARVQAAEHDLYWRVIQDRFGRPLSS